MEEISTLVSSIVKILECVICMNISSDPVSVGCGHFFCRTCITAVLKENFRATCPLCKKVYTKRSIQEATQRKSIVKAVRNVVVAAENLVGHQIASPSVKLQMVSPLNKDSMQTNNPVNSSSMVEVNVGNKKRKLFECDVQSGAEENDNEQQNGSPEKNVETNALNSGKQKAVLNSRKQSIGSPIPANSSSKGEETQQTNIEQYLKKGKSVEDDSAPCHKSSSNPRRKSRRIHGELDGSIFEVERVEQNEQISESMEEVGCQKETSGLSGFSQDKVVDGANKAEFESSADDTFTFVSSPNLVTQTSFNTKRKKNSTKIPKSKIKKFIGTKKKKSVDSNIDHEKSSTAADISISSTFEIPSTEKISQQSENKVDKTYSLGNNFNELEIIMQPTVAPSSRNLNAMTPDEESNLSSCKNYEHIEKSSTSVKNFILPQESDHIESNVEAEVEPPKSPPLHCEKENVKVSLCKSPGWSRIKQMNKDFHFKTFPTLHVQKSKTIVPYSMTSELEKDDSKLNSKNKINKSKSNLSRSPSCSPPNLQPEKQEANCKAKTASEVNISEELAPHLPEDEETTVDLQILTARNASQHSYEKSVNNKDVKNSSQENEVTNNKKSNKNEDFDNADCSDVFVPEATKTPRSRKQNNVFEFQSKLVNQSQSNNASKLVTEVTDKSQVSYADEKNRCEYTYENLQAQSEKENNDFKAKMLLNKASEKNTDEMEIVQDSCTFTDANRLCETYPSSPEVLVSESMDENSQLAAAADVKQNTPTCSQAFSHQKIRKRLRDEVSSTNLHKIHRKISKPKSHLSKHTKNFLSKCKKWDNSNENSLLSRNQVTEFDDSFQMNGGCSKSHFMNIKQTVSLRNHDRLQKSFHKTVNHHCNNPVVSSKTKVVKRVCLTLEEIETYFQNFYSTGENQVICSAPLPATDFLLQLNIADETFNISVLKILREEHTHVETFSKSLPPVGNEIAMNENNVLEKDATVTVCPEIDVVTDKMSPFIKNMMPQKNSLIDEWYYDEENELLPETQPVIVHEKCNSQSNLDEAEKIDMEFETSVQNKSIEEAENCAVDENIVGITNDTSVENNLLDAETPTRQSLDTVCMKNADIPAPIVEENSLSFHCSKICDSEFSESLFVPSHQTNQENIDSSLGKSNFNECSVEIVADISKHKTSVDVSKNNMSYPDVDTLPSRVKTIENEKKDANLTDSLLEKQNESLISPTFNSEARTKEKDLYKSKKFIDEEKGSKNIINVASIDDEENCNILERDELNESAHLSPQSCPASDEFIEEIDPFGDTDEIFSNASTPKYSDVKIDELIKATEDYSSDPDMIFATNLVAPLKTIAEKMEKKDTSFKKEQHQSMNQSCNGMNYSKSSHKEINPANERSSRFNKLSKKGKVFKRITTLESDDSEDEAPKMLNVVNQKGTSTYGSTKFETSSTAAEKINDSKHECDSTFQTTINSDDIHTGAVNQMKLEIQEMNEKIRLLQEKIAAGAGSDESSDSSTELDKHHEEGKFQKPKPPHKHKMDDDFSDDSKESSDLFMEPIPPTPPSF